MALTSEDIGKIVRVLGVRLPELSSLLDQRLVLEDITERGMYWFTKANGDGIRFLLNPEFVELTEPVKLPLSSAGSHHSGVQTSA